MITNSINDATISGSFVLMMAAAVGSAHDQSWIGISAIKEETRFPVPIRVVERHFEVGERKT